MNDLFKNKLDALSIPETSLTPSSILFQAMQVKKEKQKKEARLFFALQLLVVIVLIFLMAFHLKAFLWLQLPISLSGILAIVWAWLKGAKTHEH